MSSKYYGGFWPGETLFAIDGDLTQVSPHGAPQITFPLEGDSIVSKNKIAVPKLLGTAPSGYGYELVSLGDEPNVSPWQSNQSIIMLEQEFICAQSHFMPAHLNSYYNPDWALGWEGMFPDGFATSTLAELILVRESTLENIGAGLVKLKRTYVTFPNPRSVPGAQYPYQFPMIANVRTDVDVSIIVRSNYRLHETFFLFDYYNVQNWSLISEGGYRINNDTPDWRKPIQSGGILIPGFRAWNYNKFLRPMAILSDATDDSGTVPTATEYMEWVLGDADPENGLPVEIAAEDSTFTQWLGNIWVRRTPYLIAQ